MTFFHALFAFTLVFTSNCAQAEVLQSKLGLWERFCVQNKIGDACGRAVKSLYEKIEAQDYTQIPDLRFRLQRVGELGCGLKNKISCEAIRGEYVSQMETEEI